MLFSEDQLMEALQMLVEQLVHAGAEVKICIVGAAAVTFQLERARQTNDIDALYTPTREVDESVKRIAAEKNWPETWLNNAVKMFASQYDTDADWELLIEEQRVAVLTARPPLLLAMKLLAGRGRRDAEDIDRLIDACEITSLASAQELFDRYYPTEVMAAQAMRQLRARFSTADSRS